jgi:hypothetical protein
MKVIFVEFWGDRNNNRGESVTITLGPFLFVNQISGCLFDDLSNPIAFFNSDLNWWLDADRAIRLGCMQGPWNEMRIFTQFIDYAIESDERFSEAASIFELKIVLSNLISHYQALSGSQGHHFGCNCTGRPGEYSCDSFKAAIEWARSLVPLNIINNQ